MGGYWGCQLEGQIRSDIEHNYEIRRGPDGSVDGTTHCRHPTDHIWILWEIDVIPPRFWLGSFLVVGLLSRLMQFPPCLLVTVDAGC